ncbi:MAG: STAS domain-containing protein [Actinobacteria bacterium]|nr:STAS domain-containing protein [Actinomycetota bacterium]
MSEPDDGVSVDDQGRVIVVGDIDVVSAPLIEQAIRQAEDRRGESSRPLVMDVSKVRFIDSSGLRVLLAASSRNLRAGRRVVLESPGATLTRLLEITGTGDMFVVEGPSASA